MTIILTLLCRNEADIIASNLDFHLYHGVDHILAIDNGSSDGTTAILEQYQRRGVLRLFHEPTHNHDQAVWISRLARIAAQEYNADWVIHCDADEFWWPTTKGYYDIFESLPDHVNAVKVERSNFLPPPEEPSALAPFHQLQTIRERVSLNHLGQVLPCKVCHRGDLSLSVTDGNHEVLRNGESIHLHSLHAEMEILHFPVRSYQQFERKIRLGAQALSCNDRIPAHVGITWRRIYEEKLLTGALPEYYQSLRPEADALAAALASGELLEDRRLQLFFLNEVHRSPLSHA